MTGKYVYRICSNGRHSYNYFQAQKNAASIQGQLLFEGGYHLRYIRTLEELLQSPSAG